MEFFSKALKKPHIRRVHGSCWYEVFEEYVAVEMATAQLMESN